MPDHRNEEQIWIEEERAKVVDYLRCENVDHLGVGEYPAFHVVPYLALWVVESRKVPGQPGWWAISGDLPTDCISATARHPREALRMFSRIWSEVSECMLQGIEHPDYRIGTPEQWPELGDLLKRRASILDSWVDDDELWEESGSE